MSHPIPPQFGRLLLEKQQQLALGSVRKGDYRAALEAWRGALELIETGPENARATAIILHNMAYSSRRLFDTDGAIGLLHEAIRHSHNSVPPTTLDDHAFRGDCWFELGQTHADREELEHAVHSFAWALEAYDKAGDVARGVETLLLWGRVLDDAGDTIGAINLVNSARRRAMAAPDLREALERADSLLRELLYAVSERGR